MCEKPPGGPSGGGVAGAELTKKQATRSCGVEEQAAPLHQYCCNTFFVDSSMYDTYTGITVMLHTGHTQGSTGSKWWRVWRCHEYDTLPFTVWLLVMTFLY